MVFKKIAILYDLFISKIKNTIVSIIKISLITVFNIIEFLQPKYFGKESYIECPKIVFGNNCTPLIRKIVSHESFKNLSYNPIWWARNGHFQTILTAILMNKPKNIEYYREIINLPDGGQLALDWAKLLITSEKNANKKDDKNESDLLVVLPGLTGTAEDYGCVSEQGLLKGFQVVVFNKRGHGGVELKTAKLQPFGYPHDLNYVLNKLKKRLNEKQKIFAIGFSAGSGLLVSYLGHYHLSPLIDGGVCVSPGYDSEKLWKILPKFYSFLLLLNLKRMLWTHRKTLGNVICMKKAISTTNFEEFEHSVYAKPNGYDTVNDYWKDNNPINALPKATVPVLCINSLDDPVCIKEMVKLEYFHSNVNALLCLTNRGGHCAFFDGNNLTRWADKISFNFIELIQKECINY